MRRLIPLAVLLMCVTYTSFAHATSVYYSDLLEWSPDGTLQLDAVSPDNAGERDRPFAQNFVYTLRRQSDSTQLWSHSQGEGESSPIRAYVHNDGWVAVWTGSHRLMILDKDTGEATGNVSILEQFPESESKKYVHRTTAGPMWSSGSMWGFATLNNRTVFVITTGWGRRIVMDCADGVFISLAEEDALRKSEISRAKQTLQIAVENPGELVKLRRSREDTPLVTVRETIAALAVLIRAEDASIAPMLRQLETSTYIGMSGGLWEHDKAYEDGVVPFSCSEFTLRRIAQFGLRRLGEKPVELPGVQIDGGEAFGADLPAPRAERVDLIEPGIGPRAILEAIGHPDLVRTRGSYTWEYDIDDDEAYTLIVHFDEERERVERVERTAPVWRTQQRWDDVFWL